eukprot:193103_1
MAEVSQPEIVERLVGRIIQKQNVGKLPDLLCFSDTLDKAEILSSSRQQMDETGREMELCGVLVSRESGDSSQLLADIGDPASIDHVLEDLLGVIIVHDVESRYLFPSSTGVQ